MPELGKYSVYVLSAYGATILLLVLLVAQSLWRSRKVKSDLARIEERRSRNG